MNAFAKLQQRKLELGWLPKKSLGQNFLVSDHVVDKILSAFNLEETQALIEIGPGLGALTDGLSIKTQKFQLIELDKNICQYWRDKNYNVLELDALSAPWESLCSVPTVLVSNLPYQISSSLVIELSVLKKQPVTMILMFQKEVAQRIKASMETEHYGLLSVLAQTFWKIQVVCEAGPRDFFPPPKVASRVLRFDWANKHDLPDPKKFLSFIKQAFSQRRKLMQSNLSNYLQQAQAKDIWNEWLARYSLNEKIRAENVNPEQFVNLYLRLYGAKGEK